MKTLVSVTVARYNEMIYDFGLWSFLAELPTTQSMFDHAGAELKKYLSN